MVKKFQFKVLFDSKTGVLQGTVVNDSYGNPVGSAIVIADADGKLPVHNNRALVECRAEMIVDVPQKKKKGEITLLKRKSKTARANARVKKR